MGRSYVAPVRWVVRYERGIPGGALSLKSTNYPDQGHHGDRPLLGKIPTVGPGIEPGTSCLLAGVLTTSPRGWSCFRKLNQASKSYDLRHWLKRFPEKKKQFFFGRISRFSIMMMHLNTNHFQLKNNYFYPKHEYQYRNVISLAWISLDCFSCL
jgi:hypothetical protein